MIPLVDLSAQYARIEEELIGAIEGVLKSGQLVLGPEVEAFEEEFAHFNGARFGVGVNSGTSALHLALLAAGVGPGDEVITVPFTFVATVAAIVYTGARPVLVDVEPFSLTMDPSQIERAITPRTKAILPVHLYGQPAEMDQITAIARRHDLVVIEDAAQAHGAEYRGGRAGSLGDLACFSFYPGKNLGACGEAGMVVTSEPAYAQAVRLLRDWGQERRHHHSVKAYNYRMEALQGAVLRVKLRYLDTWTEARRSAAARYSQLLTTTNVETPAELPDRRHVYHLYVLRTPARTELKQTLFRKGVHTGLHYPVPVHLQPAYQDAGYNVGDFPVAEEAARTVLSLPLYPELAQSHIELIAGAVGEALADLDALSRR